MPKEYSNLRRNPFTGAYSYRAITDEIHAIAEFDELPGIYGFQLLDKPKTASVTVAENVTGGSEFTQVTTDPLAGQCRIDYTAGYVFCNIADNGKECTVDYDGGGTNMSSDNLRDIVNNEDRISSLEEDVQATGGLLNRMDTAEGDIIDINDDIAGTGGIIDRIEILENKDSGWLDANEPWTFASADDPSYTFTVSADVTTKYSAGMKIKLTQTTVKYFIITAVSAFGGGITTITVYGGTDYDLADAAISANYYSTMKAPFGFPLAPDKWTVEVTDTSSRTQSSPNQNTWYNLGTVLISIPLGVWRVEYFATLLGYYASNSGNYQITLSTANNSESDVDFTAFISGYNQISATLSKSKILSLAAKTSYYINSRTKTASVNSIFNSNDDSKLFIRAICAYL